MATKLERPESPLVIIAGPTASGKTSLAVRLAQQYGGEIICADSRTIYRGMDIGTAKPTAEEQAAVPHWGLDLVEPGDVFTVADFKNYALEKIADIRRRGRIPFLVGGTGFYIDAVLFDFQFGPAANPEQRSQLESKSVEELHNYCKENNIELPENSKNKRHLIRAIERKNISVMRSKFPPDNSYVVGIATELKILRVRIESRAEQLFTNGVVEEAIILGKKYGWESEAMTGNIYPLVHKFITGQIDEKALRANFATSDWRLAKRQLTWLRRNEYICWADLPSAEQYLSTNLATRLGL